MEIWKPIELIGGVYSVSNYGRVRNNRTNTVMALSKSTTGYPIVGLWKNNKCRTILVHRLVAMAFLLNPEGKKIVNHKDFDRTNNHIDNLEWCTQKENIHHSVINNRHPRGETSGTSKLTREQVAQIHEKRSHGVILKDLAKEYGISLQAIHHIVTGKNWKHAKRLS